jgi:hypothetical protein
MLQVRNTLIKNDFSEITVQEAEQISLILTNSDKESIEKYIDLLVFLGMDQDDVEDMSDDEFFETVKRLNIKNELSPTLIDKFSIGEYTYVAHEGEFNFKLKDLSLIEKYVKQDEKFLAKALAVIFKRKDLSNKEHYNESHIEEKAILFSNLIVKDFIPYVIHISAKVNSKLQILNELR